MKGKNTPEKTKNVEKAREEQKMGEKTIEKMRSRKVLSGNSC